MPKMLLSVKMTVEQIAVLLIRAIFDGKEKLQSAKNVFKVVYTKKSVKNHHNR